jgi:16S rRNA (guanine1207-N2)-methyltransferase
MSHYFQEDKNLNHDIRKKEIFINDIRFEFFTDRGVFSKENLDFGTRQLLKRININQKVKTIIDMGCGYGPIGIYLAKMNPNSHVYMYDINSRAIDLAQKNSELNQVTNTTIKNSYLFEHVDHKVDLIVTNPPIRAGKEIVFDLYEQSYLHLNQGGSFYCVIQKKQGAASTYKKLMALFSNCVIVAKEKGYWILLSKKA